MIASRVRESKRNKTLKLSRNLQRMYKEGKCRKCSVVVTRMDFAKILGKFTKVKIQYESVSSPKRKDSTNITSKESVSPINARLKNNENGMVLLPRNAYNQHPAKELKGTRSKPASPLITNVLKENNRLKKTPQAKKDAKSPQSLNKKHINSNLIKQYKIVFTNPKNKSTNDHKSKATLSELIPLIDNSLLPSLDWSIEYLPKSNDIKGDKVYDRIAAELEDLMYNEKPKQEEKPESSSSKVDDFPSIMDILNDNTGVPSVNNSEEIKVTLESSDVEAMLLGKVENTENTIVENTENIVENGSESASAELPLENLGEISNNVSSSLPLDRSSSPSILNETTSSNKITLDDSTNLKMDAEDIATKTTLEAEKTDNLLKANVTESDNVSVDNLGLKQENTDNSEPSHTKTEKFEPLQDRTENSEQSQDKSENSDSSKDKTENSDSPMVKTVNSESLTDKTENTEPMDIETSEIKRENMDKNKNENNNLLPKSVTQVIFKKTGEEKCYKSVTCFKNLKYIVELDGKQVEFIGAPKFISSLEDLRVLLQIVNESELESLYVLH